MTTTVTLFVTWLLYNMNTFYLSKCKLEVETPISTVKISAIHYNGIIFFLLTTVIILKPQLSTQPRVWAPCEGR